MPPTYRTLSELAGCADVAEVLAAPRDIVTVMPKAVEIDGEMRLVVS
ncbi:hypothetical protein GCM10020001_049670 [Nonomuraea salmonea]